MLHTFRMKSFRLSGPQIMEGPMSSKLRSRNNGYKQMWKLYHKGKWVIVVDRYYEHKWVISLSRSQSITFFNGRCLYRSRHLNPRLLYKAFRFFYEVDPTLYDQKPDLPDVRRGYTQFLKEFRRLQK
jgi:hypothetical protein